jgi:hypothetical protein
MPKACQDNVTLSGLKSMFNAIFYNHYNPSGLNPTIVLNKVKKVLMTGGDSCATKV